MKNRMLFFIGLVLGTGFALILADFLLLLFFGYPFSKLAQNLGIPSLIFILIYSGILGKSAGCFSKTYFHNVKQEVYFARLKIIGAVPIKMIGLNVVLHAAFLSFVFFGSNYLDIEPVIRTPIYLASLSFGMLTGTFIYVVCDGLVSTVLTDNELNKYPRQLREGRQALKALIIPVAVGIMSVIFAYAVTMLSIRMAGGLENMQGWSAWSVFLIPIITYNLCVIYLAIHLKKNSARLYTSIIEELENLSSEDHKDLTTRITLCSIDELGTITGMMNTFCDQLGNEILKTIKNKVNALTNTSFELTSNMVKTSKAVDQISANFEGMKGLEHKQESEAVEANKAVDAIKLSIDKLKTLVEEQSNSLNTSSSAIEQMIANIQSVTRTLVENTKNVEELTDASEHGKSGLQTVAQEIQEIARDSEGLLEINSLMNNIAS